MGDLGNVAAEAAEAVRALNHRLIGPTGGVAPAELAQVVAKLGRMAAGLPQLLALVGRQLRALETSGAIRLDGDGVDQFGTAAVAVRAVDGLMAEAAAAAADLGRTLQDAHQISDTFGSPMVEQVPDWYGLSTDTAQRGLAELAKRGVLCRQHVPKKAPLVPKGYSYDYRHTLTGPFANKRQR